MGGNVLSEAPPHPSIPRREKGGAFPSVYVFPILLSSSLVFCLSHVIVLPTGGGFHSPDSYSLERGRGISISYFFYRNLNRMLTFFIPKSVVHNSINP
jgi:hypothetical protein